MSKDFDLDEIRKRQRELVEMKKVKQGQVEAPKVDLDAEKIVPHTGKEKRQNFWYHYKWVTIGSVLIVALLVFFTVDLIRKPKPDLEILAFNKYQAVYNTDKQKETFQKFAHDINGNGKVYVAVNGAQTYDSSGSSSEQVITNPQMVQVASTKLIASFQAFEGFIYLMDESTYNSVVYDAETGKKADVFVDLSKYTAQNPAFQGDKLYLKNTDLAKDWGLKTTPDDLFLCIRDYDKYNGKQKEKLKMQFQEEKKVFDNIIRHVLETPTQADSSSSSGTSSK